MVNITGEVREVRKILIVDDQKGVRRLLEELFKKDNWEVQVAHDGREAVEKADEFLPDIILMDMKMPNMNGLEASRLILERHGGLDILMMTAYGEMDVVKEALDAGVKKCITKPFDIINLRDVVNQIARDKVS
jgi:two-component system response regulator (stage 0 sporulation protein F)